MPKQNRSLKVTVAAALLTALSIVCGKYLAIRGGDILRFSFENLPVLLAGIAFGPVTGGIVGAVADLLGCVLVGYTINPIITAGGTLMGVLGGVLYRWLHKCPKTPRVAVTVLVAHLICSVGIKTFGLAVFYSMPLWQLMLWRLLNYLLVGGTEAVFLCVLLKSKGIRSQLNLLR
jgi:ECF transporter S component (folate family)